MRFIPIQGNSRNLPSEKNEGYMYLTADDGKFYIDHYRTQTIISDGISNSFTISEKINTVANVYINKKITNSFTINGNIIQFLINIPINTEIIIVDGVISRTCLNDSGDNVSTDDMMDYVNSVISDLPESSGIATTEYVDNILEGITDLIDEQCVKSEAMSNLEIEELLQHIF